MGKVAALLGKPLMPWQQYVADVILEIEPATGELAYAEFGLTVPRQSGKSILLLAKAAHRCHASGFWGQGQQVVYTAQTRKDARKKFEVDYAGIIRGSAYFKGKAEPRWGNGNEHIRFPNGSRFSIEANTEKAGHGGTLDEAYIDEAFAQVDRRLEGAFGPAMITRRNKQLGWISTAGWLDGSPYLEEKVKWGREQVESGSTQGLAYFEWSAPEDADPEDRDLWPSYMPALGHTISAKAIGHELDKAKATGALNDFRRAYMNLWVPKSARDEWVIPESLWMAHADPESRIVRRPSFGLYVSPLTRMAAIAVAGDNWQGRPQVEITVGEVDGEHVLDYRPGTEWLIDRLKQLADTHKVRTVNIYGQGTDSLRPEIERAGLKVAALTSPNMAAGCGMLQDLASLPAGAGLVHIGQRELTRALSLAEQNETDHGWQWGRRKSAGDISPLVAATAALWAHTSQPTANFFAARR